MTQETHTVLRTGEPALVFTGDQLSYVSSEHAGKSSWTELTLYRTTGGSYVVAVAARTTRDGWREFLLAEVYRDSDHLVGGVKRTHLMRRLLEHAVAGGCTDIGGALLALESSTETLD